MIGTYNEAYTGELHTPEGLLQSIPQAVQPIEVISAASSITERLVGLMGLVTTNGGALNDQDMGKALSGVEAMVGQLHVVLAHPTTATVTTIKEPSSGAQGLIELCSITAQKAAAMMNQIDNAESTSADAKALIPELEQLIVFIDAIDSAALKLWRSNRCEPEFDGPESYLASGLPAFSGMPYELINTMTIRAKVSAQVTARALQADSEPMQRDTVSNTLWGIRGQIEMIDAVLKRVDAQEASQ